MKNVGTPLNLTALNLTVAKSLISAIPYYPRHRLEAETYVTSSVYPIFKILFNFNYRFGINIKHGTHTCDLNFIQNSGQFYAHDLSYLLYFLPICVIRARWFSNNYRRRVECIGGL